MTNYIADDTDLNFPKTDRRALPPGADGTQHIIATHWNTLCQGVEDIQEWLGRGVLDARAFGAVGNGSTDDTAAIQRALDAAEDAGSVVYLPRGIHMISD